MAIRKVKKYRRIIIAAVAIGLLYVLSSGPANHLAVDEQPQLTLTFDNAGHGHFSDGSPGPSLHDVVVDNPNLADASGHADFSINFGILSHRSTWWDTIYAPLVWMSQKSWGEWVGSYWDLFVGSEAAPANPA
jgi:hypothetical protein